MLNLLRLKNWQIFWLATGLHLVAAAVSYLLSLTGGFHHPMLGQFVTVVSAFCLIVRLAWMYSMAKHLNQRLPGEENLNLSIFRGVFVTSIIIRISLSILPVIMGSFSALSDTFRMYFSIITTMSIISWVALAYLYYFIARSIVAVELSRPVYLSEYIGTFFLLVFYPLGIWWIQPRLNKIFDGEAEFKPDTPLDHNLS